MSTTNDYEYWKKRALNPDDAFGESEKKIWMTIEPILIELLDELKANGKIETVFVPSKTQHMDNIISNLNQISLNHNLLIHLADSPEKINRFLKVTSEFGLDDAKLTHLYVEVSVLLSLMNAESFKTLLLFHLKDVNYKASKFSSTMETNAPNAWKKLKPFIYNEFRNSLAHGTWAIENKQVVLFRDAELVPYAKLELYDFWIKSKEQNLLYTCLAFVINEKIGTDFFS